MRALAAVIAIIGLTILTWGSLRFISTDNAIAQTVMVLTTLSGLTIFAMGAAFFAQGVHNARQVRKLADLDRFVRSIDWDVISRRP